MATTRFNAKNGLSVGSGSINVIDDTGAGSFVSTVVSGTNNPASDVTILKAGTATPSGKILNIQNNTGTSVSSIDYLGNIIAASGSFGGDVSISGNLSVLGTQTIVSSTIVNIGDNIVQLNTQSPTQSTGGLYVVDTTSNETGSLIWDSATNKWKSGLAGSEVALASGTGTDGLVTRWTGASTLGTGIISDDGTKVGIGTTTFTSRFFVSGSSTTTTPTVVIKAGTAVQGGGVGIFDVQNSAGTSLFFVSGSGNIGIGTSSPAKRLHILSSAPLRIGTSTEWWDFVQNNTNEWGFLSNASLYSVFMNNATGNVGIGITATSDKLAVGGSMSVTGSVLPGTNNTYNLGSASKRWANVYAANISGSLTGSNVLAGQVVVAGTGGVLSGSNNFWWDNTNSRVGIGTASPTAPLHVFGAATTVGLTTTASAGILRVVGSSTNALFCGAFSDPPYGMCLQTNSASYPLALQPAGGNVGIGTASPGGLLHLSKTADTDYLALKVENIPSTLSNTSSGFIGFYSNPGNGSNNTLSTGKIYGKFDTNSYASARLTFSTATGSDVYVDTMTLKNNMVGIGTASPTKPLTVVGKIGSAVFADGYLEFLASGDVILSANNTLKLGYTGLGMSLLNNGNVGIGTSSFTGRLYVSGSSTGTTTTLLARHGIAVGSNLPVLDVQNSAGTSLLFVSGSGNVGIGTTVPANALDVRGTLGIGTPYNAQSATENGFTISHAGQSSAGGIATFAFPALNTNDEIYFNLSKGGGSYGQFNVNFGATPTSRFQIAGGSFVNGGNITLTPAGNTHFAAGNVGIGTSGLDAKLVVNGSSVFSGSVSPDGDATRALGSSTKRWATVYAAALSGSLTRLTDNTSYLIGGTGIDVVTGSSGAVTHSIKDSIVATISGSTFTGAVKFNAGLSGSLTTLANGDPYLLAGTSISLSTGSTGAVTIALIPTAGSVVGTGTTSYVPRWTNSSTIAAGTMWDDGTNIGIGTNVTNGNMLSVNGTTALTGSVLPGTNNTYNLGSASKRWANVYAANISGSLTGSNVLAGQVVVAGTGGVLSGSNNFWWDNTNSRVGIGTTSPQYALDVAGTIGVGRDGSGITYDSTISHSAVSPFRVLTLTSLGGGGTWRGAVNIDTNYNAGSTFTAMTIKANTDGTTANVGIGTSSPGFTLEVNGTFAAATKSFAIDHPLKPGWKLRYGSLESPYHGIRLTGQGCISGRDCVIDLPEYISSLCTSEGAQVQITNFGHGKNLWIHNVDVENNRFTVRTSSPMSRIFKKKFKFFWSFTAIRKDVPSLIVEMKNE